MEVPVLVDASVGKVGWGGAQAQVQKACAQTVRSALQSRDRRRTPPKAQARSPDAYTYVAMDRRADALREHGAQKAERMPLDRTAVAILAVQQLHGMANVVHMGGHAHEGEAGRAKERLRVLQRAVREAHSVSLGEQPAVGSQADPHRTKPERKSAQARKARKARKARPAVYYPNIVLFSSPPKKRIS